METRGEKVRERRAPIFSLLAAGAALLLLSCGGVINLPSPTIAAISPTSVAAGGPSFTLTVTGKGFAPCSVIVLNGSVQATIFLGANELTTAIGPSGIANPGTVSVQVLTPSSCGPGGGTSNMVQFTITPVASPVPQISSLSPSSLFAEISNPVLTVTGANFVAQSVVTVDGGNRQTTFVNSTDLSVSLLLSDVTVAGTLQVAVLNPPPGGGSSNKLPLTVVNPSPIIFSVAPASVAAGTSSSSLTVSGSNLDTATQILINGSPQPTTFLNVGQVISPLASSILAAAGTYSVQVVTPAPGGGISAALPFSVIPTTAGVGLPELADVANDGSQANDGVDNPAVAGPVMDTTGRFIAFASSSTNLVANDTNAASDVFLRDTCIGGPTNCTPITTAVSLSPGGNPANGASAEPSLDSTGHFMAFTSTATNLVPGINFSGSTKQVFIATTCAGSGAHSTCLPAVSLISVAADNASPANADCSAPAISPNGRFVAFVSTATNLVAGATTGVPEIYLRDTCELATAGCTPSTVLVSAAPSGVPAGGASSEPVVASSTTGQFVSFASTATNLISGSGGVQEIYRATLCLGISTSCTASMQLISTPDGTTFADGPSSEPAMTPDGRFVAFASTAMDLGAPSGVQEIFVRDTCTGVASCTPATSLISVGSDGVTPGNALSEHPAFGKTGQFVAFASLASNLVAANLNGFEGVFVRNTCAGSSSSCTAATALASVAASGAPGNGDSANPALTGLGHIVAFFSAASNLVNNDTNTFPDIFLAATTF